MQCGKGDSLLHQVFQHWCLETPLVYQIVVANDISLPAGLSKSFFNNKYLNILIWGILALLMSQIEFNSLRLSIYQVYCQLILPELL